MIPTPTARVISDRDSSLARPIEQRKPSPAAAVSGGNDHGPNDYCLIVGNHTKAGDQARANRQKDERFVQPCFAVVTAEQFFDTILVFEKRLLISNQGCCLFSCDAPQLLEGCRHCCPEVPVQPPFAHPTCRGTACRAPDHQDCD